MLLSRRVRSIPIDWPRLRRAVQQILLDHDLGGELSVTIVDDETITRLHGEYLGEPTPTDVISFPLAPDDEPLDGPESMLGEVVASAETAEREATKRGIPVEREIALYVIHGTLHLAGYDDVEPRLKRAMRRAEARYLKLLDG